MLEVLQYLFSSFWVWFGMLVWIIAFGAAISAVRGGKED